MNASLHNFFFPGDSPNQSSIEAMEATGNYKTILVLTMERNGTAEIVTPNLTAQPAGPLFTGGPL